MADLDEVQENPREDENEGSGPETEGNPAIQNRMKQKRSRGHRNSGRSQASAQSSPPIQGPGGGREEDESRERNAQQHTDGRKQGVLSIKKDYQAQFYEDYRKVSEEYDKAFFKKHEKDLDTTLIFSGLFSPVASVFIIEVNSELKPDPGGETVALLRVLIYKVDSSTFGGDVPTLPQWNGPSRTMVLVQSILFASLTASLFSAFLAMLGKQWLNRYTSTDMRGTAAERGQSRQRKLDGITAWYFERVVELLPLMLQVALLLFGCAHSRYLWDVDITIASVVASVTSLGIIFYIFMVVAGAVSESCPYQTPASDALRYVCSIPHSVITSPVVVFVFGASKVARIVRSNTQYYRPQWSRRNIGRFLRGLVREIPPALITDAHRLGRAMLRALVASPAGALRFVHGVYNWFHGTPSAPGQELNHKTTRLNLGCISWTLRVSLDKDVHLSTFKHLLSIPELAHFDPTLVLDCFRIVTGCVSPTFSGAVITEGLEQLAILSAGGFLRTLLRLFVTDPTSGVLTDFRRSYATIYPTMYLDQRIPPPPPHVKDIFLDFVRRSWDPCEPPGWECCALARDISKASLVTYRRTQHRKVPRWILRAALHYLSLDPPPPPSAIADCLQIVAIDLGCDISDITTVDESARVERVSSLVIQKIRNMTTSAPTDRILSKRKAVSTLLPYAIHLGRGGQQEMVDAVLSAASTPGLWKFVWRHVEPYFATLFDKPSPPSLDRAITLLSPHVPWEDVLHGEAAVARWAASASAVPYSEEIGQSVVDALLQIASADSLRPLIPVHLWTWLKKRPILPPLCRGRDMGRLDADIIRYVRGLGDLEILKSFFLLLWSEWSCTYPPVSLEFKISIRKDFGGTGKWHHREDLVKRLDHVLVHLDKGPEHFQLNPSIDEHAVRMIKRQYKELRDLVLEVDRKAMETLDLSRSCPNFICALPLPCP